MDAPKGTPEEWDIAREIHDIASQRALLFKAYIARGFSPMQSLQLLLAEISRPEIEVYFAVDDDGEGGE